MTAAGPRLAVIAKAPRPGAVKTRLTPPLSPTQAAAIAEAALVDTLAAARAAAGRQPVVLVLDGRPGRWLPPGVDVLGQHGAGLDERLANAFVDIGEPALVIGMDTPQVSGDGLAWALERLVEAPAVLGPAADGGYWAIGLRRPDPLALRGVPMSVPHTFAAQRARLRQRGLRVAELERLRDVDTFDDALAVAAAAPRTLFARRLGAIRTAATGTAATLAGSGAA
jgi:rSAM/selenodomain-associated transferase 1